MYTNMQHTVQVDKTYSERDVSVILHYNSELIIRLKTYFSFKVKTKVYCEIVFYIFTIYIEVNHRI